MPGKKRIGMTVVILVAGMLMAVSCTQKTLVSEPSVSEDQNIAAALPSNETATAQESGAAAVEPRAAVEIGAADGERRAAADARPHEIDGKKDFPEEMVLFDYDSSNLTAAARERLERKARWLAANPEVAVIIQGHCDERGTAGYNLALGERRALAAKGFLVDLGISTLRLSTVSYGEDRPFAGGHDEGAWRLNRRAHFVVE